MNERLGKLRDAGVSIWLDTLSRDLLDTGEFAKLISEYSVTGATSNPSIFAAAITGSSAYDDQLTRLKQAGQRNPRELFFALALDDIRRAADQLRATYDTTGGQDGFISFEVTPDVAHDAAATVEQAVDLWRRINRPNAMIKVPATPAGVDATARLTAAGVNVNVTLLFSVARYAEILDAFSDGLEHRRRSAEPLDRMASVASFFVSRVDTVVDAALPDDSSLRGQVAIANAAAAYRLFRDYTASSRWHALADAGARAQRPLWASTGTKDSHYSDVLYVETLVAPGTVNTMPLATLKAYADHGDASVQRLDTVDPRPALAAAQAAGVDLDTVTAYLEHDGITRFADAYATIVDSITLQAAHGQPT